jgi:hypothetical protein
MERRTNARLRVYLTLKARAGRFDPRMCDYFGVSPRVNAACKKAICRAYAAGLVPTSTTGGQHAPGSLHYEERAVDIGCRNPSSARERKRLRTFHRKEFWRARNGKIRPTELIGPHNDMTILRGRRTTLPEGSSLEQAHDNHVHEGY